MDRRSFFAISSAAVLAVPSFGQDQVPTRTDGNWWKDLSVLAKAGYAIGFADGSAKADAVWASGECKASVTPKYLAAVHKENDYSGILIGQIVDGLDRFYNDFRNTRILTQEGMMIVKWQISGVDQKSIDEALRTMRQVALDPRN